jgi:hypothetical protein
MLSEQWDVVASYVQAGVSENVRENVATKAANSERWDVVASIVQAGVSENVRENVATKAANSEQWDVEASIVQAGISEKVREKLAKKAANSGQWDRVVDFVRQDVGQPTRDMLAVNAAACFKWDCVMVLVKLGVSPKQRNRLFADAMNDFVLKFDARGIEKYLETSLKECLQFVMGTPYLYEDQHTIGVLGQWSIAWSLLCASVRVHGRMINTQGVAANCRWLNVITKIPCFAVF